MAETIQTIWQKCFFSKMLRDDGRHEKRSVLQMTLNDHDEENIDHARNTLSKRVAMMGLDILPAELPKEVDDSCDDTIHVSLNVRLSIREV